MTKEDKELLLKDLCARLPYGVKCAFKFSIKDKTLREEQNFVLTPTLYDIFTCTRPEGDYIKPYLRPMSSMTKEEKEEYDSKRKHICDEYNRYCFDTIESFDWLNAHHFDCRGLIEKGLAIEINESNNPYKE